jgi:AcrR family transcriptional regulator
MPARKSTLQGDDLRLALLDAAGRLLHDEGPHALSTRRLADAVGTSTQAIYTLFGAKDGVVRAMYREGFARLLASMRAAQSASVEADGDALDALYRLGVAYRAAALASPYLYDVMFATPVPEFVCDDDDRLVAHQTLLVLVDAVQRAIDAGMVAGPADLVARHLWICTHGFVSLELAGYLGVETAHADEAYGGELIAALDPFLDDDLRHGPAASTGDRTPRPR